MKFQSYLRLSIDTLLKIIVVYSIGSSFLWAYSSTGWTSILYLPGALIVYGAVFLFLWGYAKVQKDRGNTMLVISSWHLISIALLQLMIVLLNIGDCGDGPGSTVFLERLLSSHPSCGTHTALQTQSMILIPQLLFLYAVVFTISLFYFVVHAVPANTKSLFQK